MQKMSSTYHVKCRVEIGSSIKYFAFFKILQKFVSVGAYGLSIATPSICLKISIDEHIPSANRQKFNKTLFAKGGCQFSLV